jgi:hypothetical protein
MLGALIGDLVAFGLIDDKIYGYPAVTPKHQSQAELSFGGPWALTMEGERVLELARV